jgi:hypothetical protein
LRRRIDRNVKSQSDQTGCRNGNRSEHRTLARFQRRC